MNVTLYLSSCVFTSYPLESSFRSASNQTLSYKFLNIPCINNWGDL